MKFYGKVGFWLESIEVKPGVYKSKMVEKDYTGDISWDNRKFQSSEYQNDELRLNNSVSILSDMYMQENIASIKYISWKGAKWKVTNVEIGYPRITLTIGGVYNGTGAETNSSS
jgi:hypothetical protein